MDNIVEKIKLVKDKNILAALFDILSPTEKYSHNQNGIFFNLSKTSDKILQQLQDFVENLEKYTKDFKLLEVEQLKFSKLYPKKDIPKIVSDSYEIPCANKTCNYCTRNDIKKEIIVVDSPDLKKIKYNNRGFIFGKKKQSYGRIPKINKFYTGCTENVEDAENDIEKEEDDIEVNTEHEEFKAEPEENAEDDDTDDLNEHINNDEKDEKDPLEEPQTTVQTTEEILEDFIKNRVITQIYENELELEEDTAYHDI